MLLLQEGKTLGQRRDLRTVVVGLVGFETWVAVGHPQEVVVHQ